MTKLQDMVEQEILEVLPNRAMSNAELAQELKRNYYTVRNATHDLMSKGLIRPKNGYSFRNVQFVMVSDHHGNNVIPVITIDGTRTKLTKFLSMRNKRQPAVEAIESVPRVITRLLLVAHKLHKGEIVMPHELEMIRTDMEFNRDQLKNFVSLYDQILGNTTNWNPEFLKRYPRDDEFDMDEIQQAYQHYYATED